MAKMVGTDKIWYLFGVTLGLGVLILTLFCLILYRTCRHYKAKKASSAAKRPASSPSGVSTPSLSRKPSHKRCPVLPRSWRLSTGWPREPPAPLESHHRRSPHHPVSRKLKTNQPTLHTPSRSKLIVISKLIVKCKISFYLLIYPNTYLPLSHSTFFLYFRIF